MFYHRNTATTPTEVKIRSGRMIFQELIELLSKVHPNVQIKDTIDNLGKRTPKPTFLSFLLETALSFKVSNIIIFGSGHI